MKTDSEQYLKQKNFLKRILTVYGRKPVLELINDASITIHKVHFSDSNKPASILKEIEDKAQKRGLTCEYHSKQALSRISKNSKQDQGIAADIYLKGFIDLETFLETYGTKDNSTNGVSAEANNTKNTTPFTLIALDNVTNPQNVGMIIRSVCASPATGLIIPEKGCAKLDALVIKASAGTLFKAPIIRTSSLNQCLKALKDVGADVIGLDVNGKHTLSSLNKHSHKVYVLGNETDGISQATQQACTKHVAIKMHNGVESLNVAVTASLIAFNGAL